VGKVNEKVRDENHAVFNIRPDHTRAEIFELEKQSMGGRKRKKKTARGETGNGKTQQSGRVPE